MADESETCRVRSTEVNDHDRVNRQVPCRFRPGSEVDEFRIREIAHEHRVLQAVAVFLHQLADLTQA